MLRKSPTPAFALERIEQEIKERTGSLILTDCGMTEFPTEVLEMNWLEELIITDYDITSDPFTNTKKLPDPNHIAEIPYAISQLSKLKKLRIGPSGTSPWSITEIHPLVDLKNLEELDLSNNRIHNISALQQLKNLKSLNLAHNEINQIFEVSFLKDLVFLDLSFNQIQDIMDLQSLSYLEEVYLSNNEIAQSLGLHVQKDLRILNMDHNKLVRISELNNKPVLSNLSLQHNQIYEIEHLVNFVRLEILNLAGNSIDNIFELANLIKLKKLNLTENKILDLFPLARLTRLQELYFSGNEVADITSLAKLTSLKHLHCEANAIDDISPIANLIHLKDLNLGFNYIKRIQPLTNLHKLETLKLDDNPIEDALPEVWQSNDIDQIRAIFEGTARDTKRIIEKNKALENIQKKRDKLQEQSHQMKQEVEEIQIKGTPRGIGIDESITTESPDNPFSSALEAVEKEQEAIEKELKETEKELKKRIKEKKQLEDIVLSDVKLIFVGNSGVGKTQLSKYFESSKLDKTRKSTHGIRLNRWLPEGKVSPAFKSLKDKIAVNVWDFGGQEYYHGTFRLFLSNYAVYILLWDAETNQNQVLPTEVLKGASNKSKSTSEDLQHYHYRYWLDNIRHYAPTSPVILIQNKVDRDPKDAVDTKWLKDYQVSGDHYLSLHEAAKNKISPYRWGFDLFCSNLARAMESIPESQAHWKKSIAWIQIRDAVVAASMEEKKDPKNPFSKYLEVGEQILIEHFEMACQSIESELTDNELKAIPRWLHNSGAIIYFHKNEKLKERVYLNPTWVTEGIYSTLSDTVRKNDGEFTMDQLPDAEEDAIAGKTVVELMKEMEIIFEKSEQVDGKTVITYVAPQYLPETHPVEDLYAIAARGLQQKAYFIRLPLYFFRKVLQRLIFFYGMSQNVDARYYWKRGILFEKRGTRVMFKGIMPAADEEHGVFLIGAEPAGDYQAIQKELFHVIIEILEEKDLGKIAMNTSSTPSQKTKENPADSITSSGVHVRSDNWTLNYDDKNPRWLEHLEVSTDNKNFANYLQLCNANRAGDLFISNEDDQKLRLHDFQLLLDSEAQRPLKIFLSYSHKDTDMMDKLSVHLAPLKRLKKIETWSDKAIQAGEEWDTAINDNLRNSDIILFLVSPDFIASSYIWDKEIPLAIKLQKDPKERVSRVIPVYLRPFDFSGLKGISDKEMVPKFTEDGKNNLLAVSQWDNIDEAFKVVVGRIREAIDSVG